jgi:hypothetical protein
MNGGPLAVTIAHVPPFAHASPGWQSARQTPYVDPPAATGPGRGTQTAPSEQSPGVSIRHHNSQPMSGVQVVPAAQSASDRHTDSTVSGVRGTQSSCPSVSEHEAPWPQESGIGVQGSAQIPSPAPRHATPVAQSALLEQLS